MGAPQETHKRVDQELHDQELKEIILKTILSEIDLIQEERLHAGFLPAIRTHHFEYHVNIGIIRLIEVGQRFSENGVLRHARLYFDPVELVEDRHIPVICVGNTCVIAKICEREGGLLLPSDEEVHVPQTGGRIVLRPDQLITLPGVDTMVGSENGFACAYRKASFQFTGYRTIIMGSQPAKLKLYSNLMDPDSREFFGHVLSWDEVSPLLSVSPIGPVSGVCVTNSLRYRNNHPELDFISVS